MFDKLLHHNHLFKVTVQPLLHVPGVRPYTGVACPGLPISVVILIVFPQVLNTKHGQWPMSPHRAYSEIFLLVVPRSKWTTATRSSSICGNPHAMCAWSRLKNVGLNPAVTSGGCGDRRHAEGGQGYPAAVTKKKEK